MSLFDWSIYFETERKHAMPDITVEHAGYKVVQTYAFTNGCYGQWWYDINGKFVLHSLGEYKTAEQLKDECENMDEFLSALCTPMDKS